MERRKAHPLSAENRNLIGKEREPGRLLKGVVEKFWFSNTGTDQALFEILPDGNFDLVLILNDSGCRLFFAGPYTRKTAIPVLPGKAYFGVIFRPGTMPRLADLHPTELINTTIELPGLLGTSPDCLGEGLLGAHGMDARKAFMEKLFLESGIDTLVRQDLCHWCTQRIASSSGQIKVKDLAGHAGISRRTLERIFLKEMGISPKMFIRLVRFHNAVDKLKRGRYSTLTHLAYESGYADQSHFIWVQNN